LIRVLHILDPELKGKVCEVLSDWRGFPAGNVPEWFEMDDADYVDILNEIKRRESGMFDDEEHPLDDPRS